MNLPIPSQDLKRGHRVVTRSKESLMLDCTITETKEIEPVIYVHQSEALFASRIKVAVSNPLHHLGRSRRVRTEAGSPTSA